LGFLLLVLSSLSPQKVKTCALHASLGISQQCLAM
jgi:hypothetical protein